MRIFCLLFRHLVKQICAEITVAHGRLLVIVGCGRCIEGLEGLIRYFDRMGTTGQTDIFNSLASLRVKLCQAAGVDGRNWSASGLALRVQLFSC